MEGATADAAEYDSIWAMGRAPPSVAVDPTATAAGSDSESDGDDGERAPAPALPAAPSPPAPDAATSTLSIVFVTAELPYCKTGGLGDVAGALPPALAARGHRVMVVSPRYATGGAADAATAGVVDTGVSVDLDMGACGAVTVRFFAESRDGVDYVYVDHPSYRRPGTPYGDAEGQFGDNQFRFAMLSMAACEAPLLLELEDAAARAGSSPSPSRYGQDVAFIANDWHAALVPVYVAAKYRPAGVFQGARCLMALHNMSHQGVEPAATVDTLGLHTQLGRDLLAWQYPEVGERAGGGGGPDQRRPPRAAHLRPSPPSQWASITGPAVNLLKGGIAAADRVVTVSAGYAWEIQTPEGGWGLDPILRGRADAGVLNGIVNGVDVGEWDPGNDPHTAAPFAAADLKGKAACKAALQAELGLEVNPDIPLLGFVGRLDYQKSPDVCLAAAPGLAARGVQLVMLGSGAPQLEAELRAAEAAHPAHVRGWVGFSAPVSHRIMAGADILLVPSRYEPCGLVQLYAARYGTLVVAHATGGLRQTVVEAGAWPVAGAAAALDAATVGTGWLFTPPEVAPMLRAVDAALGVYRGERARWAAMQGAAMRQDLTWDKAAAEYETVLRWALIDDAVVR